MFRFYARDSVVSLAVCLLLLLVAWQSPAIHAIGSERLSRFVDRLFDRRPNLEDKERAGGGYYETLLKDSSQIGGRGSVLLTRLLGDWSVTPPPLFRQRPDFLAYDYAPNDRRAYTDLQTNEYGMADSSYAQRRAAGVRRIAVLGDSMSRGWGAPFGEAWEPRLERWMNVELANRPLGGSAVSSIEVLNFAVDGYRLTQITDVIHERAPSFQPDVYVLVISDVMVSEEAWATHLARLLRAGQDLKYPFLRATITPRAPLSGAGETFYLRRLQVQRVQTFRWTLDEMTGQAARDGAAFVAVLMPSLTLEYAGRDTFADVRPLLAELRVRTIDMSDAYSGTADLDSIQYKNPYRDVDVHPNTQGHALLFERLRAKIEADPELSSILFGGP